MPPTADIATPDRFRHPSLAWLLAPLLLVATWTMAGSHHLHTHALVPAGVTLAR